MKNWKTTLIGGLIAAGMVVLNLYQTGTVNAKTLIIAAGFAFLGALSKDYDKTGLPGEDSKLNEPTKTDTDGPK